MKALVFDTSSVISIVTNNLLWIMKSLKTKFGGEFFIPDSVKLELIDKPLESKKYKLEAIMVSQAIDEGYLVIKEPLNVDDLLLHLNQIYTVNGRPIHILDRGEVEAFALALRLQADAYVVDERTMRLMIENPSLLRILLENKLHTKVEMNNKLANEFSDMVKGVKIIRSTELLTIAYELGLLNKFVTSKTNNKDLIDGLLWGLRLRGCAISTQEIEDIVGYEIKR